MSGWWLLTPAVLVLGTGLVGAAGRRLQREAAGVRAATDELRELGDDAAALAGEVEALEAHLAHSRRRADDR